MMNGPTIEGELLELMRNVENTRKISPKCEQFTAFLDTIMDLAEIATQAPEGTLRMVAVKKLREINPNLQIVNDNGKRYLHGLRQNEDEVDVFYEIPGIKPLDFYQRKYS